MSASLKSQEAPKGPKVVFGTTLDRSLFTEKPLTNRLGGETVFHHDSHLGPGCYENDEATRSLTLLAKHVESNNGHGFSIRTANRFPKPMINDFPSPAEYQRPKPKIIKPAFKPFNTALKLPQIKLDIYTKISVFSCNYHDQMMPTWTKQKTYDNPGPGTYEFDVKQNRRVTVPVAFGRKPLRNSIKIKYHLTEDDTVVTERELRKIKFREAYLSLYF